MSLDANTQKIIDSHNQFMTLNYPRYDIAFVEGEGCELTDADGNKYLDLFAGFGAGVLGHCHPDLVAAGTRQMNKLWHVGNLLHTRPQTELAERIAAKGFGGRSYFCHSGNDANEAAFKLARLYGQGKRFKIISTTNSFHGRGFAGIMATGQEKVRKGFEPLLEGFSQVPFNDLQAIDDAIDEQTVAIIVEPIQGEGGMIIPNDTYLPGLRKLCDQHDLLLIFDEVWTGCGRTGKYFAYQHWQVEPDIMTLGKAIGCGLPVGVMCVKQDAAVQFDCKHYGGVMHATTLGGNCVSMAVAARLFEVLEQDKLVERAAVLGQQITSRLRAAAERIPAIIDIRGKGLFIGIELDAGVNGSEVVNRCMASGVIINCTQGKVLRIAPPLTISDEQIDKGLSIIEQAIAG